MFSLNDGLVVDIFTYFSLFWDEWLAIVNMHIFLQMINYKIDYNGALFNYVVKGGDYYFVSRTWWESALQVPQTLVLRYLISSSSFETHLISSILYTK